MSARAVDYAVRGVLFDVDGTLLDSNDAHAQAWVDVLREEGMPVPFERVRPLIGMGGDKVLPELTGLDAESERGKAIAKRRGEIFTTRYLPSLQPFAGARALVERLRADGLRLVVATSAQADEVDGLLRQAGVADLLERKTTSSDAGESKPDPDIVEAALARGALRPGGAVMIGDTPYDVEAARRAGVPCIALRCGGWWDDAGLGGAAAVYNDPAHLLAELSGSPLALGAEDSSISAR